MTPADIERAVTALRRAFPYVSDEGVERFRRELAPLPKWTRIGFRHWSLHQAAVCLAQVEALIDSDRWVWSRQDQTDGDYASTRSEAMRAAERALGLPECEVVNG